MHKETLNPVWNFECDIEIERTYKHVDIEIFDKDPVRSTDGARGAELFFWWNFVDWAFD